MCAVYAAVPGDAAARGADAGGVHPHRLGKHVALLAEGALCTLCAQGLVMPPRVAPTQVVVIPIAAASMAPEQRTALAAATANVMGALRAAGLRATCDDRDNYRPGWKYNHWEVKVRARIPYSVQS